MKNYSMFYNWIYWLCDCDHDKMSVQILKMLKRPVQKDMKPCPFCGSPDIKYFDGWSRGGKAKWRSPSISCAGCGMGFSVGSFGFGVSDSFAKEETVRIWNMRKSTKSFRM